MEPVTTLPAHADGWTVQDLDDFPDDGLCYELVDGSLHVSPPPTNFHDYLVGRFVVALDGALDDSWCVIPGGGVRFDTRNYREPDLMVIKRDALHSRLADPGDVLLAIEVMSPSSVTTDRLVKPAQYAAAGIPHFWRLELGDAPVLVPHELQGGVYREAGRFHDEVVLEEPVRLSFRLDELLG